MKINSTNVILNNKQFFGHRFKPSIQLPCFRGCNLLDLPEKDIFQRVEESITPENFIGQGMEAEVYKIKGTEYCVRIPLIRGDACRFKYTKQLSPIDKINHVVAKLGCGVSIIKFFEGETPKKHRDNMIHRYQFQEKISNMPVKSYSNLLHQIANAINNEMLFDFSGGNLIVDIKNNKLTAVDFYGISDNPVPIRPLTEMYSVLTCYGAHQKTGKKIFNNIVNAGLEEFKPTKIPCMDIDLFDFEDLCFKRCKDSCTENHEKIINEISRQLKELKSIKKAEIIDKTKDLLLEQNISKLKNLLSKIH